MSSSNSQSAGLPAWASIVIWISLGTSMIMFNKVLLTTWGFRFPCLLTTWHCALATVLTQLLARTSKLLPSVEKGTVTRSDYFLRILPMAVCFAFGLVAGNMAYAYISLAYIQMIKAFTPVPLLLLSFVSGLEKPSLVLFAIVLVVSAGVTLSSVGELQFSMVGFLLQFSAVLVDCFRMILMNLLLKDLNLDSLSLLYYTAPPSAVLIFCGFLFFEAQSLSYGAFTPALCVALVFNGLLAFTLNIAVIYLVSSTSAVVMSVSGPLKDILIVVISVLVFHSPVTLTQVCGFAVSLAGLYMYREYKSDPRRAAELFALGLGCLACAASTSTSTSSSVTAGSGSVQISPTGVKKASHSHSHGFGEGNRAAVARHSAQDPPQLHSRKICTEEADTAGQDGDLELQPLLLAEAAGDRDGGEAEHHG